MIVEFTGCTGTGKTSLAAKVQCQLANMGISVVRARQEVRAQRFLNWLPSNGLQNMIVELVLTPFIARSVARYSRFLTFSYHAVHRYPRTLFFALRAYRGVWRQIGLHEMTIRRLRDSRIVLFDEGTVHTAHYLFVQVKRTPSNDDLENFCKLVPMPDLIVCLEAPTDTLVERMAHRRDPPRRGLTRPQMERLVHNGLAVFERLRRCPSLASRWLVVRSDSLERETLDATVDRIVERILRERRNAQTCP